MSVEEPSFVPFSGILGEWVQSYSFYGKGNTFGYFKCNQCNKTWMSARSKKGYKQGCKDCDSYYEPAYLWKNEYSKYDGSKKSLEDTGAPHMSSLCEACQKGVCEFESNSKTKKRGGFMKKKYYSFW